MKPDYEWTRRDFLKTSLGGALGAAGLIHFSKMAEALGVGAVSRFTGLPLDTFPTTCTLCNARCGILAYIQNGQLKGLLGNPNDPNTLGRICIRGLAGVNLQNDEDRILQPIARKGKRGEGKWRRITWDEAFSHLSRILKAPSSSTVAGKRPIILEMGQKEILTKRFLSLLGTIRDVIFLDDERDWNSDLAHQLTWGDGKGIPDLLRAKTILNFGANPYSHHDLYVPFIQRLIEAKTKNRAKLVSFDVRLSETAGLSDRWFPVAPGTDGLVALAMARVIVEHGLHDRPFIEKWTNCTEERLRHLLSPYTPERAEDKSGVKAEEIRKIAIEFAKRRPSVAFAGGGVSQHVNGIQGERSILILNAVCGNIDQPGGYCLPKAYSLDEPDISSNREPEILEMEAPKAIFKMLDGSLRPETYLIYMANPAYNLPQSSDCQKLLASEKMIPNLIAMDTHMSETAALADMVLPAATYLECWGIESRPSMEMIPFLGLRQPVVNPVAEAERLRQDRGGRFDRSMMRPKGNSLSWNDFVLETTMRMGGDIANAFPFRNVKEYLGRLLGQFSALKKEGGLAHLQRNGVWIDRNDRPGYQSYRSTGFQTKTGRLEIYSKELDERGFSPFPSYDSSPARTNKREFVLVPFRGLPSEGFPNAKWLCELVHENPVWMNAQTARTLGFADKDKIEIISKGIRAVARVRTTQGIHPGVVAISRGLGHPGYGHFAQGSPFKGINPDSHLIWWKKQGNGAHIEPLVQIRFDPISGGQAWMETLVEIKKA